MPWDQQAMRKPKLALWRGHGEGGRQRREEEEKEEMEVRKWEREVMTLEPRHPKHATWVSKHVSINTSCQSSSDKLTNDSRHSCHPSVTTWETKRMKHPTEWMHHQKTRARVINGCFEPLSFGGSLLHNNQ